MYEFIMILQIYCPEIFELYDHSGIHKGLTVSIEIFFTHLQHNQ